MIKDRGDMALRAPAEALTAPSTELLVINTREELINALDEAVRIEHSLMLQYLYAAFSMKRFVAEGLTERQVELTRDWERRLLEISHDEMAHLGTACNLLMAIGGRPSFARPHFPQPAGPWYPFDFELERFSERSLERFVRAESPPPAPTPGAARGIAPDPIRYSYVGDLYRAIATGFEKLDADFARSGDPLKRLFIGRPEAQSQTDWTANLRIFTITDVPSAKAAIDFIVRQGEGTASGGERSHYHEFSALLQELGSAHQDDPAFEPARAVVSNPLTRPARDAGAGAVILAAESIAHPVAELFAHAYGTMLMMLSIYFDPAGETVEAREQVQASSRRAMSGLLRPLAEVLTTLPATADEHGPRAGATFELYGDLGLPAHPASRIAILVERLEIEAAECVRLAELHGSLVRLRFLARNFEYLRAGLAGLRAPGATRS